MSLFKLFLYIVHIDKSQIVHCIELFDNLVPYKVVHLKRKNGFKINVIRIEINELPLQVDSLILTLTSFNWSYIRFGWDLDHLFDSFFMEMSHSR